MPASTKTGRESSYSLRWLIKKGSTIQFSRSIHVPGRSLGFVVVGVVGGRVMTARVVGRGVVGLVVVLWAVVVVDTVVARGMVGGTVGLTVAMGVALGTGFKSMNWSNKESPSFSSSS